MTSRQVLLVGSCAYLPMLAATVYFTRATRRRFLGALAGGLTVAVVGIGVESSLQALGFWHYPSADLQYGPSLMVLVVLIWALLALLGWRVARRFGWRGQAVFLTAVTVVGALRDFLIAAPMGFIVFAPGPGTVLVDAACWAGTTALAQAVMRVVAGPALADRLARAGA